MHRKFSKNGLRSGKIALSLIAVLVLVGCKPEPSEINYRLDTCSFCRMNIVDKQHAAEVVTKKGKAYKFDAIECMLNDLKSRDANKVALFLVNTYDVPISLHDATASTYLVCESIPSPMGAYLSAFSDSEVANEVHAERGGELYDWESLRQQYLIN